MLTLTLTVTLTVALTRIAGDVLFVPSMFFVSEESLTPSASVRWGSGGLARDVWNFVVGQELGALPLPLPLPVPVPVPVPVPLTLALT